MSSGDVELHRQRKTGLEQRGVDWREYLTASTVHPRWLPGSRGRVLWRSAGWIGPRVHVQWNDLHFRLLAPQTGPPPARAPACPARLAPAPRRRSPRADALRTVALMARTKTAVTATTSISESSWVPFPVLTALVRRTDSRASICVRFDGRSRVSCNDGVTPRRALLGVLPAVDKRPVCRRDVRCASCLAPDDPTMVEIQWP